MWGLTEYEPLTYKMSIYHLLSTTYYFHPLVDVLYTHFTLTHDKERSQRLLETLSFIVFNEFQIKCRNGLTLIRFLQKMSLLIGHTQLSPDVVSLKIFRLRP